MKKIIIPLLLIHAYILSAQINSRNGYSVTPQGTIRAFIVFAEAINDSLDKGALDLGTQGVWSPGQLPPNIDDYIDYSFTDENSINGFLTKYFYEASFGNLKFLGDYYPNLIQIDFNTITGGGVDQVMQYLNNMPGTNIYSQHGYLFNSSSFDAWTPQSAGIQKINNSDNYIDVFIILWRSNSKLSKDRNGGTTYPYNYAKIIKNKSGTNCFANICSSGLLTTFRHEFAHSLLGSNQFHSGGAGAGNGTYLSDIGGYSLLGSWNKNINFVNAWDRWRLGWKFPSNNYFISARNTSYAEISSDFYYGQTLSTNEYILRDFATTGDAIRIKLPYLKTLNVNAKEQYIWIENHQMYSDKVEYNSIFPIGIRFNIQVGNDNLTSYANSTTNYISPLCSFGNYDFTYSTTTLKSLVELPPINECFNDIADEPVTYYQASTSSQQSNPFTGYHLLQQHAINFIEPNHHITNSHDDYHIFEIFDKEYILPVNTYFNGTGIFINYFTIAGTQYDAFPIGTKLSIASNPSSSSLLTYNTTSRYSISNPPNLTYNSVDNRYIYLNGLSIEILEQKPNGDIRIRIKWNDFDVNNDVRWCGPIVLNEKVYLKSNKTITLDQGLTPTKPVNPITFYGEKVFSDPTIFTCKINSHFKLELNSSVDVKNNSVFVLESGSLLEISADAKFVVKSGCTLKINHGANLLIRGAGRIEVESGGFICIENGANITLQDGLSVILLRTGYQLGVNTNVIPNPGTCISNLDAIAFSGNGSINTFSQDTYVQNETFTIDKYITGNNIFVGRAVTTSKPQGDVIINNGVKVIFEATQNVNFEVGYEVKIGGSSETK